MAEPILHKSPSKEPKKTESMLDSEICLIGPRAQFPAITEPIHTPDILTPTINAPKAYYLPGTAGYLAEILEETVSNLTLLQEYLSGIEKMLVKGGEL